MKLDITTLLFPLASCAFAGVPTGLSTTPVCSSGCDETTMQAAYDAAVALADSSGDTQVVLCTAGQSFSGFTMTARDRNAPWIYVASSAYASLTYGVRIPYNSSNTCNITTPILAGYDTSGTLNTNHVVLEALTNTNATNGQVHVVQLDYLPSGSLLARPYMWPDNIIMSHMIVKPAAFTNDIRNSVTIAGDYITLRDSWIEGGHTQNNETHGIFGINIGNHIDIINNTVWGAGTSIGFLFGGSPPQQRDVRATNVRVLGNWFMHPFDSRVDSGTSNPTRVCFTSPDKDGTVGASNRGELFKNTSAVTYWQCQGAAPTSGTWVSITSGEFDALALYSYATTGCPGCNTTIKNVFEFKAVESALVEGNIFEGGWQPGFQSQYGACILFNSVDANPGNGDEFRSTIRNVTVRNNICRHAGQGIAQGALGTYNYKNANTIENNLFWNVAQEPLLGGLTSAIKIIQMSGNIGADSVAPNPRFIARNNTAIGTVTSTYTANFMSMDTSGGQSVLITDNVADDIPVLDTYSGAGNLWNAIAASWAQGEFASAFNLFPSRNSGTYGGTGRYMAPNQMMRGQDASPVGAMIQIGNKPSSYSDTTQQTWYTQSDVYTNVGTGDLTLKAAYAKKGSGGVSAGARWEPLLAATGCANAFTTICDVVSGTLPPYLRYFTDPTITLSTGSITATYNSVSTTQQCTLTVSGLADVSSGSTQTDTTGTFSRTVTLSYASGSRAWGKVGCGGNNVRYFGPVVIP